METCRISRDDGLSVWTSSGIAFLKVESPAEVNLPLIWKFRLRRAITQLAIAKCLGKVQ